jgi:PBSX family phage terminase large subunit
MHLSLVADFIESETKNETVDASGIFERPKAFDYAFKADMENLIAMGHKVSGKLTKSAGAAKEFIKYLLFKGGRGSGKTFAAISKLIEESFHKEFRKSVFLVMRELIGNLDDIEETILDVIDQAGLSHAFSIKARKITNIYTKCAFVFRGARSTSGKTQMSQINKLKGLHKVRRVLIDEAQDMSEETLAVLLPTVNRSGQIKVKGKELKEPPQVQWIFCMNPNMKRDPAVAKVETQESHAILHVNIFDIESQFQDKQLLENAASEEGQYYYRHVWLGEEFYRMGGYPFATTKEIRTNEEFKTYAFLDPSFAGGDMTALSFICNAGGKIYFWGYCWREGWNTVKHDIVEKLREHNAISFFYESNAIADAPQEVFADLGIEALPQYSLGNKHNRIYRGAAQLEGKCAIVVNKGNEMFNKNVLEYNDEAANDDAADSLISNCMAHGVIDDKKAA